MSLFWKHYFIDGRNPEHSVYYWWFMYLREVTDYSEAHPLFADFGDVKSTCFEDWWGNKEELLFDDGLPGVVFVETPEALQESIDLDRIILSIDRRRGRKELVAWIDEILSDELSSDPGRPTHEATLGNARYAPHSRPDCPTLKRTYQYHQLIKEGLDNIAIAVRMADLPKDVRSKGDSVVAAEIVGKERRRAEALIRNVAQGRFPDFS